MMFEHNIKSIYDDPHDSSRTNKLIALQLTNLSSWLKGSGRPNSKSLSLTQRIFDFSLTTRVPLFQAGLLPFRLCSVVCAVRQLKYECSALNNFPITTVLPIASS